MFVKDAKAVARRWVLDEATAIPGFYGAYSAGSVNWLSDDAVFPATSDLDLMVVLTQPEAPDRRGKFDYNGVLLEVTYLDSDPFQAPESILSDYHKAASFRTSTLLADPSGQLTALQAVVRAEYAKRQWVERRCDQARAKILGNLNALNAAAPLPDQVNAWLFGTGIMTHVLLVAGLQNPTVRRRYLATRRLLEEYGRLDYYETLLEPLGCAQMSRAQVVHHLGALAEAFDAASRVIKSPFPFATDMSQGAQPIAIDGSRELIEAGYHREAVFWLVVTYTRCQKVLEQDAPAGVRERFDHGYRDLLRDLGITSFADLERRTAEVKQLLPGLWDVAVAVMDANPAVER